MNKSRKGFSLLLAIIVMITIATLMALMISLSTTTAKQTSDIYVSEQTKLLARSATELALLAISGHNNNANCIENINFTYQKNYDVNMSLYYIGNSLPCNHSHLLANNIATSESNGTVIIDTYVTFKGSSEPIRYHRRTIQKP
jgi:type II secretory pathway component PulK